MSIIINKPTNVSVDGLTIKGSGTNASPLTSFLDYHFNEANINEPGVYVYDGSFTGQISFNEIAYNYGSQTIFVINTSASALQTSGTHVPYWDGFGTTTVSYIQAYSTWTVYWNHQDTEYRIVNPNFFNCIDIDLDVYSNSYSITVANTLYRFYNNTTGYDIYLPDPVNFYGKKLNIINNYNSALGYNAGGFQPLNASGSTVTNINSHTSTTLISDGVNWRIIN
jgi:hypothetical protein